MRIENPHVKVRLFVSSPQTPFADTSSLAPSCVLAVAPDSCSGVTGCRLGSMHTSLQASVRRFAVRSRISLCRKVGKPPFLQDRACSTVKVLSQSHFEGRLDGVHPYLRARASWKAALYSVNPWSLRGRTVSQVEAHSSVLTSITGRRCSCCLFLHPLILILSLYIRFDGEHDAMGVGNRLVLHISFAVYKLVMVRPRPLSGRC